MLFPPAPWQVRPLFRPCPFPCPRRGKVGVYNSPHLIGGAVFEKNRKKPFVLRYSRAVPFPGAGGLFFSGGTVGRTGPLTDEEKAHLRAQALERLKNVPTKKEKGKSLEGVSDPSPAVPLVPTGGRGRVDPPGPAGSGGGNDGERGGGGSVPLGGPAGASRRISLATQNREIVINKDLFLGGLPALLKLHFFAGNNLLKIFNLLPLPIKFEIEPLTDEEAKMLSEAVKPGLEANLPNIGRKYPIWVMGYSLIVTAVGKLKAKWVGFGKKKTPEEVRPASTKKTEGGLDDA